MEIVGKAKEDVSLPKATMTKIIKEMLPAHVRVTKDAQDLLVECCVEFINLISSESNEICYKEEKRTIAPEHVLESLKHLMRHIYSGVLIYGSCTQVSQLLGDLHSISTLILGFGSYIREVHAAYEQHRIESWDCPKAGSKWAKEKLEMTEEEALLEQQRMFAEARARMNSGNNAHRQSQSE